MRGVRAGRMRGRRDIQAVGTQVKQAAVGGKVRVSGQERKIVVTLDMGEGLPVAVLEVDETDPQARQEALAPLVKVLGVGVSGDGRPGLLSGRDRWG